MEPWTTIVNQLSSRDSPVRKRFEFILKVYSLSGAVLSVLSIAYFMLRKLNITIDEKDQFTLAIAASGGLLFLFSKVMLLTLRERDRAKSKYGYPNQADLDFLKAWSEFEKVSAEALGEDAVNRPTSARHLISRLISTQTISEEDATKLEEALAIRNYIAHGGGGASEVVVRRAWGALRHIIRKISESRVNPTRS